MRGAARSACGLHELARHVLVDLLGELGTFGLQRLEDLARRWLVVPLPRLRLIRELFARRIKRCGGPSRRLR